MKETLDWAMHIGIAIVLALLIIKFVAQLTIVEGTSMLPTLQNGDRLIIEKVTQRLGTLQRGDIVAVYVPEEKRNFIKRIIGLEGDSIEIKSDGKVYVNGEKLNENYTNGTLTRVEVDDKFGKVTVPKGQMYVMGDNRMPMASRDSRNLGPMETNKIVGRAIFRCWPLSALGSLKK